VDIHLKKSRESQMLWHTSLIPALRRQEDHKFEASIGYTARPCLDERGGGEGGGEDQAPI
jgi:hypothetical protein